MCECAGALVLRAYAGAPAVSCRCPAGASTDPFPAQRVFVATETVAPVTVQCPGQNLPVAGSNGAVARVPEGRAWNPGFSGYTPGFPETAGEPSLPAVN